jgi:hypothetical protein
MLAQTLITPRDLLVPAIERFTVEVEVERRIAPFWDPASVGVEVQVEGIGRGVTDADGVARIPADALRPGTRTPIARAGHASAAFLIRAVPKETPVFAVDLDHTIADVSSFGFVFKSGENVRPIPGAREALERLSARVQIVYLTARDHIFTRKTRDWLRRCGFPEAPIVLRRKRFWSERPKAHKLDRLAELRERFPNLAWGVGDLRGDVEAYAEHGLRPILFCTRPPGGLPEGTQVASTWEDVERIVATG